MVEEYRERLFRVALGFLGNGVEAEEIAQETFVQVFRHLGQFRGESSFYTWICRICVNLCLRRREQLRQVQERESSSEVEVEPVDTRTPEDELAQREQVTQLWAALRALPKEYRAVLVLREMNSLSYEEIAEVLGLPMGTVKSRVHRGRLLLKDRLRGYFQGERDAP